MRRIEDEITTTMIHIGMPCAAGEIAKRSGASGLPALSYFEKVGMAWTALSPGVVAGDHPPGSFDYGTKVEVRTSD